jgi:hypothetical protein
MKISDVQKELKKLENDIASINEEKASGVIASLSNLLEFVVEMNLTQASEIQKLKDEINRLKKEQGKPTISPNNNKGKGGNHSSENDRKDREPKKTRQPKAKKAGVVKIDKEVICDIDPKDLPDDAKPRGCVYRVVQDIKIITDNVKFTLKTYYSPSLKKTFIAPLPDGYKGEFGPSLKALVITLYRDSGMTQSKIHEFLNTHGTMISASTISLMLTENHQSFHEEKEEIIKAGLAATPYQHIDDTGCKVNGVNQYTHILCSPYFTAFFTRQRKDRLTLLDILCSGNIKFRVNSHTYELASSLGLSDKRVTALQGVKSSHDMTIDEMNAFLLPLFPNPEKSPKIQKIIKEAAALAYYASYDLSIQFLVSDDAPQFNKLGEHKVLCWIHAGRHLKKLNPTFLKHRKLLDEFLGKFWDYYALLLIYKEAPTPERAKELTEHFDSLFSTKTKYQKLDDRIALIAAKKESLILVLQYPFLPLHNNPAELGARVQARMRDINLHTISENGTACKDTFSTIIQTAKKLGVNTYRYIFDKISCENRMESLANLITQKASPPT